MWIYFDIFDIFDIFYKKCVRVTINIIINKVNYGIHYCISNQLSYLIYLLHWSIALGQWGQLTICKCLNILQFFINLIYNIIKRSIITFRSPFVKGFKLNRKKFYILFCYIKQTICWLNKYLPLLFKSLQ